MASLFLNHSKLGPYILPLRVPHWNIRCCLFLFQECSNMAHDIHFSAEFSSNLNQTHLSMLIIVFRIFRKRWVWSGLKLNSAAHWPSRARFEEPWFIIYLWKRGTSWHVVLFLFFHCRVIVTQLCQISVYFLYFFPPKQRAWHFCF